MMPVTLISKGMVMRMESSRKIMPASRSLPCSEIMSIRAMPARR